MDSPKKIIYPVRKSDPVKWMKKLEMLKILSEKGITRGEKIVKFMDQKDVPLEAWD